MQPAPIYQGHTLSPAQTPQAQISANLPFADDWMRGLAASGASLEQLGKALEERNDDTAINQQEAHQKENAINLSNILKKASTIPPGAEGSYKLPDGSPDKAALKTLAQEYMNAAKDWGKNIIDPKKRQAAGEATQAYKLGVVNAINAHVLDSTKSAQRKAYKDNYDLAMQMGDTEAARETVKGARKNNVFSPTEADMMDFDADKLDIQNRVNEVQDVNQAIQLYDDPDFQETLQNNPKARKALEAYIKDNNNFKGTPASVTAVIDPATGKRILKKKGAIPPDGAPLYVQQHYVAFDGDFSSADAQAKGFKVLQRWLSEEIDSPQGSTKGDEQWQTARSLAESLKVDVAEFNAAYKTRLAQISLGGFDPKTALKKLNIGDWLAISTRDERWLRDYKPAEDEAPHVKQEKFQKFAQDLVKGMSDELLEEYTDWYTANKASNPTPRQQAEKFSTIFRSAFGSREDLRNLVMEQYLARERAVHRELAATKARKERSRQETAQAEVDGTVPKATQGSPFAYMLSHASVANNLPETTEKNIIYLPKALKLPSEPVNVTMDKGKYGFTVEFRHADIKLPALSVKFRRSANTILRSPKRIDWDGLELRFSEDNVPAPKKTYKGLFPEDEMYIDENGEDLNVTPFDAPDDGLVPAEEYEEAVSMSDAPLPL